MKRVGGTAATSNTCQAKESQESRERGDEEKGKKELMFGIFM